jgi:uncharacterized protein YcbX
MAGEAIRSAHVTARGLMGDRAYALVDKSTNRAAVVRSWGIALLGYKVHFSNEPQADQAPPPVRITAPDGTTIEGSQADIERQLSAAFKRSLCLMSQAPAGLLVEFPKGTLTGKLADLTEAPLAGGAPAGTFFDLAPVHLVATSTLEHLQKISPQSQIDVRRFRPNIVVRTSGEPFVENFWAGRKIAIGDQLVLIGTVPCPRCVNVTAEQPNLPKDAGLLRNIAKLNTQDLGEWGKLPCLGVYAEVVQPGRISQGDRLRFLD